MFCLNCKEYVSLYKPCKQGIRMTDLDKIMKCKKYEEVKKK